MTAKTHSDSLPVTTVIFTVILTAAIAINLVRDRMAAVLPTDSDFGDVGAALTSLAFWIPALVPICFIVALWSAASIFEAQRRRRDADGAMLRGLKTIGAAFIAAGFVGWLVVPFLTAIDSGDYGAIKVSIGSQDVAIGMIGIALRLIASRAQRLKTELEAYV